MKSATCYLISWNDGADSLTSFNDHVRDYASMLGLADGHGLTDPVAHTRFFVVPGGNHTDGRDLTEVNWFTAITNWVEEDFAPEQLRQNNEGCAAHLASLPAS